jgi:hypothetical protein
MWKLSFLKFARVSFLKDILSENHELWVILAWFMKWTRIGVSYTTNNVENNVLRKGLLKFGHY